MSRRKLKARDKVMQKMSRDGLVERNAVTGEDTRISKREKVIDLLESAPGRGAHAARLTYSQAVNRTESIPGARKKRKYRHLKSDAVQNEPVIPQAENTPHEQPPAQRYEAADDNNGVSAQHTDDYDTATPENAKPPDNTHTGAKPQSVKGKKPKRPNPAHRQAKRVQSANPNKATHEPPNNMESSTLSRLGNRYGDTYRHEKAAALRHEPDGAANPAAIPPFPSEKPSDGKLITERDAVLKHDEAALQAESEPTEQTPGTPPEPPKRPIDKGKYKIRHDSGIRHDKDTRKTESAAVSRKPPSPTGKPQEPKPSEPDALPGKGSGAKQPDISSAVLQMPFEGSAPPPGYATAIETPKPKDRPETLPTQDKPGKLQFTDGESKPGVSGAQDKPVSRKLAKAEKQAKQAGAKLERAKSKLPATRKLRSERVFDEKSGKPKRRLYFEKEAKTQGEHLKGAPLLRPVKAVGNAAILKAHQKIYQAENENVAVKAAHRAELLAEGGVRTALRFHKTAPYRKVAKLEKQAAEKTVKLNYQKALADNPKLSGNMLSRMLQKRKIKKDYAKAAREAKKTAKAVKQAGSVTAKAAKALASVVTKHPAAAVVILLLALLLFIFMSLFGLGSGIASSGLGGILSASYLAEDEDIEKVEMSYSEWETDLQYQIMNAESDRPGFDEYRYETGDIGHNPYELMAYLTAVYQYFSYDGISADLRALFDEQYSLTFAETTETRYADPTDADEDGDYEPYDWNILTISLDSRPFGDVILPKMTAEQREHYDILMETGGSRQYAANPFDTGWVPYVTSYYGWRLHPGRMGEQDAERPTSPITGAKDLHRGIDIAFPAGTDIYSAQDGTVTFAGYSGDYGNVAIIENDEGIVTKYAHCDSLTVSAAQTVSAGDVIGTVGSTGASTGAHLHLEVLKDGEYVNPLFFVEAGSSGLSPVYGTPDAPMGDGSYAALIEEAERHIGKPYVFGASGPNAFDCSSYVCRVLTDSGVKNMPRTTAQGIYNQCTPIAESAAQPGDLITFTGTYSTTNAVTHIGIYAGIIDGHPTMIHAGSPIQYARIDTAYWQNHFYAFCRLD
jgi:murein DD-endopeptidase MepM/ murein hydrolase activator NlpD